MKRPAGRLIVFYACLNNILPRQRHTAFPVSTDCCKPQADATPIEYTTVPLMKNSPAKNSA